MTRNLYALFRGLTAAAIILAVLALPGIGAEKRARRIVSLAPSITKSLYLLGAERDTVAITQYCPTGTLPKENIGTVLEPNIEKITALAPDLVIATKEGNNPHSVAVLRSLGIAVYVMPENDSFDNICAGFVSLGNLIGREDTAKAVVAGARKRISRIEGLVKGKPRPRVFWEVGAQPLITVSDGSFVNDFITRANGVNVFAGMKRRYPQISREEVIARNPEVIILVTMGDVTRGEETAWRKFGQLAAIRTSRIYTLHETLFTDPTPVAIADGVERVAHILYPELER